MLTAAIRCSFMRIRASASEAIFVRMHDPTYDGSTALWLALAGAAGDDAGVEAGPDVGGALEGKGGRKR